MEYESMSMSQSNLDKQMDDMIFNCGKFCCDRQASFVLLRLEKKPSWENGQMTGQCYTKTPKDWLRLRVANLSKNLRDIFVAQRYFF